MHVLPKWTEKRCKISSSIFNVCWPRPSLMSTMWWRSTQLKGTRDQLLPFKKIQTTEELKRKGKIQWTQGKEKIEEGHEWNEVAGGPGIQKFLSTFTAHNIERKTKLLAISWRKCHNKSFHASLLVDLHALQRPQAKNWEKTKADRKKRERERERERERDQMGLPRELCCRSCSARSTHAPAAARSGPTTFLPGHLSLRYPSNGSKELIRGGRWELKQAGRGYIQAAASKARTNRGPKVR